MSNRPIIDVEAYEHVPPDALVPIDASPEPPQFEIPPPPRFDPMQVLHTQRRLLRDQQRALRDMLLQLESPRAAGPPRPTPYTDLLTRSMAALDRSLGTIMHSLEHTFGTDGRGRHTQGTDR
ncbi:MAG: hypothetical protein U0168_07165 [Nannocystaceae bacterium]|jgi:hypothetical protein